MVVENQQADHGLFPRWVQHTCAVEKASYGLAAAANHVQEFTFLLCKRSTPLHQATCMNTTASSRNSCCLPSMLAIIPQQPGS